MPKKAVLKESSKGVDKPADKPQTPKSPRVWIAKVGDKVKVITKDETLEGTYMPSESSITTVIKLDNGYNIGIDSGRIQKIEVLSAMGAQAEAKAKPLAAKPGLPTVAILHTGGTIASKVDYRTGGAVPRFSPEDLLELFPELAQVANIRSRLLANMWSEDMRFTHYSIIARAVEEEIKKGCDGVIITHGTDTLHYTSAALSFILNGLPVPVLVVGSQRSSDRGSSDAATNLISAVRFCTLTDFSGVAICMHATSEDTECAILPATRTRKEHSSRRDAFQPVGCTPIAMVDIKTGASRFIQQDYTRKDKSRRLEVRDKMEEKVAILKAHPNMIPEQFSFYTQQKFKGLIIEGTGLGQLPIGNPNPQTAIHEKNKKALAELLSSGCVIAVTSQTINGRVHLFVYEKGREEVSMGMIGCNDMTTETAFVKLAWLLGNYTTDQAKEMLAVNLVGEITQRSPYDCFPCVKEPKK